MSAETIAVISGKGGVGKTTVSANLGSILSHVFELDVVVIDTDLSSSHLGIHLGFHYNPATINSVLKGEHELEESVYEHDTGIKVVPGALNFEEARDVDVFELNKVVEEFKEEADVIILDCSPGIDRETSAALKSAEKALFVARPSFTSVLDVMRTQSLVEELGSNAIGVVLNMVKNKRHEISHSEIEGFTGMEVIGEIPYDETLEKSAAQGTPITLYDPHARATRAMEDLAVRVMDVNPEKKRTGFFRTMRELLPGL